MRQGIASVLLSLALVAGLSAQAANEQVPDMATKSDVLRAKAEVKAELLNLDRKAVDRAAQERLELQKANEAVLAQVAKDREAARAETERLETERRKADEARHAKQMNMIYGVGGFVLLCVIVCGLIVVRRQVRTVEVMSAPDTHQNEEKKILQDPGIPELKEYSQRHGTTLIPFYLQFKEEKDPILCFAQLREDLDPVVVSVKGMKTQEPGISWDKRKEKIAKFIARNGLYAVGS